MKVVVVGAGMTGCLAAINLRRRGCDVSVYDSSPVLGGILRDIVAEGDHFFNGCQYLNSRSDWFADLRSQLGCQFREFDHTYGSYTSLLGPAVVHHEFAGPVVEARWQGGSTAHAESAYDNLASRIRYYSSPIDAAMLDWLSGYFDRPETLHHACAIGLQISRIYFRFDDRELAEIKRRAVIADSLLGLPRSSSRGMAERFKACLPVEGFNAFFESLGEYLSSLGVECNLGSPITPRRGRDGKIEIYCRGVAVAADTLVWAGNPVPLIKASGLGTLDNPPCRMVVHACDLDGPKDMRLPHYIQVFSRDAPITRIYVYEIGKERRATIESFEKTGFPASEVLAAAQRILACFGVECWLKLRRSVAQKRYVLYTNKDFSRFQEFDAFAPAAGIIAGAWWEYGRDKRIRTMSQKIESLFGK
jgi:hypothetical protein